MDLIMMKCKNLLKFKIRSRPLKGNENDFVPPDNENSIFSYQYRKSGTCIIRNQEQKSLTQAKLYAINLQQLDKIPL